MLFLIIKNIYFFLFLEIISQGVATPTLGTTAVYNSTQGLILYLTMQCA